MPGTIVENLYAQYNIGWFYKNNEVDYNKTPIDFKQYPMQQTATEILGIPYVKEVKPKINIPDKPSNFDGEYVVIAPHATAHAKYWHYPNGWQNVIDYLRGLGVKVVMVTSERLGNQWEDSKLGGRLTGVIDKTGAIPIEDRMVDIKHASMFIGVGSGLSWMSWAIGTKTMMISGFSYPYSEFEDCIRMYNNKEGLCTGCFNRYRLDPGDWQWCPEHKNDNRKFECSKAITSDDVIKELEKHFGNRKPV